MLTALGMAIHCTKTNWITLLRPTRSWLVAVRHFGKWL